MDQDFWQQIWQRNEIGFHLEYDHPQLVNHFDRLGTCPGDSIFVPLCGKSLDLLWLAKQGLQVVGVELSATAVADFFAENGLQPKKTVWGNFEHWQADGIGIFCGDFFTLSRDLLHGARFVYDRAALIALPLQMRQDYSRRITELIPAGGRMLLVTNSYDQSAMDGPPFSVTKAGVRNLYGEAFSIEELSCQEMIDEHPGLRQRGLDSFVAETFLLEKR